LKGGKKRGMKKILVFLGMICFMMSFVVATTTNSLSSAGTSLAELSTEHSISGSQTGHLWADYITGGSPYNEGRVRIEFPDNDFPLSDLTSISWKQYVEKGYAAHVDIYIDTDGDYVADDALVFEYAKVNPNDCDDTNDYPLGSIDTFGDKGIVDNTAYAWLNSGPAGPCGDGTFDPNHQSLADWKTTYSTANVVALEIEVDGWVAESEAFIDDVTLNSVIIEDFDNQNIQVEINDDIELTISPLTLNFGELFPGNTDVEGPGITFDATGSNVDVNVQVANVIGFPFETELKLNGAIPLTQSAILPCVVSDNICTYVPVGWTTSLSIPVGTPSGLLAGAIEYTITGPTP